MLEMSSEREPVAHELAKSQGHLWTCCVPESLISISNHNVASLAFGESHCLFATIEGDVYSFGRGNLGQLGIGSLEDHLSEPCHISSLKTKVSNIFCGPYNSAALSADGDIYMWGDNRHKQCAAQEDDHLVLPFLIEVYEQVDVCTNCDDQTRSKVKFLQIVCGETHTLALTTHYEIWAWGCGPQLGLGAAQTEVTVPTKIEFLKGRKVLTIACGYEHSLAVLQVNFDDETGDDDKNSESLCAKCADASQSDSKNRASGSCKGDKVCPLGLVVTENKLDETSSSSSDKASGHDDVGESNKQVDNATPDDVQSIHDKAADSLIVDEVFPDPPESTEANEQQNENAAKSVNDINNSEGAENVEQSNNDINNDSKEALAHRRSRCLSVMIDPQSAKDFLDRTFTPLTTREGSKRSYTYSGSLSSLKVEKCETEVTKANPSSFIRDLMSKMKTTVDKYNLVMLARSGESVSRGDSTSSQESFEVIDVESSLNIHPSSLDSNFPVNSTSVPLIPRSNSYKSLLELKQLHRSKATKPSSLDMTAARARAAKKVKGCKNSPSAANKKCPHSEVWTWGKGSSGQLGHGDGNDRSEPCCVKQLSGQGIVQVAAGKSHSLALTADGRVFTWGSNEFGQLGHSGLTGCSLSPKLIEIAPHEMVWDMAAGATHSIFVADLRAPQVALCYSGCHSKKLDSGSCICENIHKVQKLHILKKCGLVRSVFAGGPYSGCIVDRQGAGKVPTEHEFAASERKYLQHLKLIMQKVFRPLLKEGSFLEEPSPAFVQPMSRLIALWSELIDKVSMNAYDLTLLVQGRCSLDTVYMLESKDEWLELYWSYVQSLCNAIAMNGPGACIKFMCLSPNMMKPLWREVLGESSSQKPALENFHLLISLPMKRVKEYINLLNRCVTAGSKMRESDLHAVLAEWQQLLEASNREKQLATNTCTFWESVPQKVVDLYQTPNRRMIIESRSRSLSLTTAGRFSSHWFVLFSDIFMHCHFSAYESYPLQLVWVEPIPDSDNQQNAFTITLPEDTFTLTCPTSVDKTEWVCALNQAIKKTMTEAKQQSKKVRQIYDNRLTPPLARQARYVFTKNPNLKDAVYTGTWLCGRLHGQGELSWPDGRKYIGHFKNNIMDGDGVYTCAGPDGNTIFEGTWKEGKLNGLGSVRYPAGDIYEGYFKDGMRHGYGILKQGQFLSSAALVYIGSWNNNKRQGYGVLDDIQKGEKYMGTWLEDCRSGNGIVVTIDGIYYEGTFIADKLSGFGVMIFEDNTWYEGELAPGGTLSGKGILHLSNGDRIEGTFSGLWSDGIKVGGTYHKSTGTPPPTPDKVFGRKETLPKSFSQVSVPADMKWEVLFQHCKESLGIQNENPATENQHAWEAVAVAINQKKKEIVGRKKYRWHLLQDEGLDMLERIPRAGTEHGSITADSFKEISDYLAKACDCPYHPLGKLVESLVDVYRAAYLGVGANPRLLPHAVAEVRSFVKRLYRIVRVLFPSLPPENEPFLVPAKDTTATDLTSSSASTASSSVEENDVAGDLVTPSILLHPVLLPRMYPPLFMLYALHNEKEDLQYWERLVKWNKQSDLALMTFLGVNLKFSIVDIRQEMAKDNARAYSSVKDKSYLKAIQTLQHISTAFTPLEKLKVLCQAFEEITKEVQHKLGNRFIWSMDDLFPVFQYVVVRARIRHLGSEIHLIENLMDEHLCYGELGIMCTTLKACYYQIKTEKLVLS